MHTVLLSLGSNLGDSLEILKNAICDIKNSQGVQSVTVSSFYKTKPVGYLDQDDFINLALMVKTKLTPLAMLDLGASLEQKYQRVRLFKDGPRTLDIDIIAYDNLVINTDTLTIPHPRLHQRAFVLAPLNEIVPSYIISTFNKSIHTLYQELDNSEKQGVQLLNGQN